MLERLTWYAVFAMGLAQPVPAEDPARDESPASQSMPALTESAQPDATLLPPPTRLSEPIFYRTSQYDVWQYYDVDRRGRFRPVVVAAPYGAYYLYSGQPFPWVTTHNLEVMPYVVDSP